jgi:hypothetical protein
MNTFVYEILYKKIAGLARKVYVPPDIILRHPSGISGVVYTILL